MDRIQLEKIATAIYFVTQTVSDNEPLKWRLREHGLGLLKGSVREGVEGLIEIDALLSVARMGGVLSDMNVELIQTACRNVVKRHESTIRLPEDFFETEKLEQPTKAPEEPQAPETPKAPKPSTKPNVLNKGHVVKGSDTDKRRDGIVAFLADHSGATTTEIKKVVRGVSEKTIQRDLKWLIKKGLVERQGTRRWATYSLSQ